MNKLNKILNILPPIARKPLTPILWIIGILISLYILYIFTITIMYAIWGYQNFKYSKFKKPHLFNSILWQKAFIDNDGKENPFLDEAFERCYMYKDLVTNHIRLNMTHEEIIKLLGLPYHNVSYYINPELKSITYPLGACEISNRFLCLSSDRAHSGLSFYFNKSQKLVMVKMGSDNGYEKYLLRDKNISIKDIENANKLFECDSEPGYYKTIECSRDIEEKYRAGSLKGRVHYSTEYCPIEEVKTKWGYEVW